MDKEQIINLTLSQCINAILDSAITKDSFDSIEEKDLISYTANIDKLKTNISELLGVIGDVKTALTDAKVNKIKLDPYILDKAIIEINNIIAPAQSGGSQNKEIMELIRDGEFFNMTTTLYDNIMNMVNKSDQMMKNMLVINEQLDKINLNKKPLTKDDLNNISRYLNKVYEMINKTNNLFNLNDVKEEENNFTEMLFEKNNYGNEKVQNNLLYKKLEDKNKMTRLVDLINLYNNSSKDIYGVFQGMSNKLNSILEKLNEIDDRFIRSGILPKAVNEFTENSKYNTIGNLELITNQIEQIKNMFEVKMGGFFLKKN